MYLCGSSDTVAIQPAVAVSFSTNLLSHANGVITKVATLVSSHPLLLILSCCHLISFFWPVAFLKMCMINLYISNNVIENLSFGESLHILIDKCSVIQFFIDLGISFT